MKKSLIISLALLACSGLAVTHAAAWISRDSKVYFDLLGNGEYVSYMVDTVVVGTEVDYDIYMDSGQCTDVGNGWKALASGDSEVFLKEKLDSLGKRRKDIEEGIQALDLMIEEIERESVNQELVTLALSKFTKVFANIRPHEQKELLRMVLHKAILGPDSMKMALYGRPPDIQPSSAHHGNSRSQLPAWLPGLVNR
jgi:hypothetical protein